MKPFFKIWALCNKEDEDYMVNFSNPTFKMNVRSNYIEKYEQERKER